MRLLSKIGHLCTAILLSTFLCGHAFAQDYGAITDSVNKPNSKSEGLYIDGVKAEMLGNYEQADSLFQRFTILEPNEAAAYYELARLNLKNHRGDIAEGDIKKAIDLDKDNKWYAEQYASVLTELNKYEEAAVVMDQLADREENSQDYLLTAALLYQRSGEYKKALADLDKLIAKSGADEDLLYQKQQIYLKMNDLDDAAKVMYQLIAQNPKEGKYYTLLGELYDNNKEPEKAVAIYQKADEVLPNDPLVQLAWAEHYKKLNDTVKYASYVTKAITNPDLDVEAQVDIMTQYLEGISNDSLKIVVGIPLEEKLLAQHPENAQILAVYADMLSLSNQHEQAMAAYRKSVALDPSRFIVWQQLLLNYTDRKDADSLVKYSEKAMKLFPNQVLVHYLHGIGLLNLKEYIPAIKSINRAIDMQPEDNPQFLGEMYSVLGDIYNIIKEYNLSDSCFTKSLQYVPDNATVLNNYGYYLSERGVRLDDAEKMSKHALALRPGEATFLDTYGWILYRGGKYNDAKEYIQKAIDTDPQNADATLYDHLGDVYFKMNDTDKAVQSWQKAKEKGDDDPQLEKKIQERKLYE